MTTWRILQHNVMTQPWPIPDASVHCVVTSPPYWMLRDYGVEGQLGLEPTVEEYIENMVQMFREVHRVLRPDGTVWLNIGNCYFGAGRSQKSTGKLVYPVDTYPQHGRPTKHEWLKSKDLVLVDAMLALALQRDGWWLRSEIIWHKPNPIPEPQRGRPGVAHEKIFLLTKSAKYYYDGEAVRQPISASTKIRWPEGSIMERHKTEKYYRDGLGANAGADADRYGQGYRKRSPGLTHPAGANLRTVWTIASEPSSNGHYASYPTKLIEPCILAGTSEKGCCSNCGMPWTRVIEPTEAAKARLGKSIHPYTNDTVTGNRFGTPAYRDGEHYETVGWMLGCDCNADTIPCTLFDPFCGTGTTGVVALRHGRSFIGIELKSEYCEIARNRIIDDAPLFNSNG